MLLPNIQLTSEDRAAIARWRLVAFAVFLSAFVCLLVAGRFADPASAQADVYRTHCAPRHAAAVAWIDQQANEPGASELVLAERALVALRARNACMHGQVTHALELYDIILSAGRNARK